MKKFRVLFWVTTTLIFLFESVLPAFTSQTELAKDGIRHLGYPEYFGTALVVFKVLGGLILMIPAIPDRLKEWAYAGFSFDFIFAAISHWAVDGFSGQTLFPILVMGILALSYYAYRKLNKVSAFRSQSSVSNTMATATN